MPIGYFATDFEIRKTYNMSYDLYCYKSKIGNPDQDEADSVIEADKDKWAKKDINPETKLSIIKALRKHNSKLISVDFKYGEITELPPDIIKAEKNRFDHIELNFTKGELSIRFIIYDNHVQITVPYWYKGEEAKQLFIDIKSYIKIIHDTAGYFIFDPQTRKVFNPSKMVLMD